MILFQPERTKTHPTHYDYDYDFRCNDRYRDNPINNYHSTYQSAINRWVGFLIVTILVISLYVSLREHYRTDVILATTVLVGAVAPVTLLAFIGIAKGLGLFYLWLCGQDY